MSKNVFKKVSESIKNSDYKFRENGRGVEISTSSKQDDLFELMQKGDKKCHYKIGDRVKKATYESGDAHDIDTKGIVIGSIYSDTEIQGCYDAYLVKFEGDEHVCFTIGRKLKDG